MSVIHGQSPANGTIETDIRNNSRHIALTHPSYRSSVVEKKISGSACETSSLRSTDKESGAINEKDEKTIGRANSITVIEIAFDPSNLDSMWFPFSKIERWLWLGGIIQPRSDPPNLEDVRPDIDRNPHPIIKRFNICSLISITDYPVYWNLSPDIEDHLHFVIHDSRHSDLSIHFDTVADFIDRSKRESRNLFIHCHMGISRSTTLLAAYYLKYGLPSLSNPSVFEVIDFIRSKRPFVYPNAGFERQLLDYRSKLNLKGSENKN